MSTRSRRRLVEVGHTCGGFERWKSVNESLSTMAMQSILRTLTFLKHKQENGRIPSQQNVLLLRAEHLLKISFRPAVFVAQTGNLPRFLDIVHFHFNFVLLLKFSQRRII